MLVTTVARRWWRFSSRHVLLGRLLCAHQRPPLHAVCVPPSARQVQSIEFTQIEMKVLEGLQVGNECLNKMHQVMSIEEVERILDETQEAVEYQRQIDELLAGSFTQEDEDAILEELDAITQEQIELPEVPSEPLPEKKPGTVLILSLESSES
ncbi:hypothetical protein CB1_001463001 [Camelus ferus]|nr:hypothetical protein CB1_001463001 [Camelus ferus]